MSVSDDVCDRDAIGQAALVASGEITPTELVEAAIERIEERNPALNAVVHTLFDKALEAAADPALPRGPFHGVPFLLKDHMAASAGDPMFEGMALLRDLGFTEDHESHIVTKYRQAGLVLLGKTNLPELAMHITTESKAYGPCHNPWDPTLSPGGSSGGSAAAVATGMVAFAHGTDAGGSIRIPASMCGLVGLKPTRGRVSQAPDFADLGANGAWHVHGLTRTVRDSAGLLDVAAGPAPGEARLLPAPERPYLQQVGADPGRLRVGIMSRTPAGFPDLHPDCRDAVLAAGRLLEDLGHVVEETHPPALDAADERVGPAFFASVGAGVAWQLRRWSERIGRTIGPDDVEPYTNAFAEYGRRQSAVDLLDALDLVAKTACGVRSWWRSGHDLLVTPTLAAPPFALGYLDAPADDPMASAYNGGLLAPYTGVFNMTGQPAVSLPLHWTEAGLPIGVQVIADYGREDLLIRVASQLEVAAPWAHRRPPVLTRSLGR